MKILFFGDIFGRPGREAVAKIMPQLKNKYNPDVIGANVENLSHGHGISRNSINETQSSGVDFFTSGNHIWEGKDSKELLNEDSFPLVRPANYPPRAPGKGYRIIQVATKKLLIINLMGRVFMKVNLDCPFRKADEILSAYTLPTSPSRTPPLLTKERGMGGEVEEGDSDKESVDAIFVDFHAETTSEKRLLGFYLDGRVSCMVGTHTHVPTADDQILPQGTGYISDVGMCGVLHSSLGVDKDIMIEEMLTQVPQKKEVAEGPSEIGAVLFDIGKDGKCKKVKRIREIVD